MVEMIQSMNPEAEWHFRNILALNHSYMCFSQEGQSSNFNVKIKGICEFSCPSESCVVHMCFSST
jgi:hypothetical protein